MSIKNQNSVLLETSLPELAEAYQNPDIWHEIKSLLKDFPFTITRDNYFLLLTGATFRNPKLNKLKERIVDLASIYGYTLEEMSKLVFQLYNELEYGPIKLKDKYLQRIFLILQFTPYFSKLKSRTPKFRKTIPPKRQKKVKRYYDAIRDLLPSGNTYNEILIKALTLDLKYGSAVSLAYLKSIDKNGTRFEITRLVTMRNSVAFFEIYPQDTQKTIRKILTGINWRKYKEYAKKNSLGKNFEVTRKDESILLILPNLKTQDEFRKELSKIWVNKIQGFLNQDKQTRSSKDFSNTYRTFKLKEKGLTKQQIAEQIYGDGADNRQTVKFTFKKHETLLNL